MQFLQIVDNFRHFFYSKVLSAMINLELFVFVSGFNAPHDRNENSSPSSTMLVHPQQHQPVSQSSMSYNNVQINSAHKNISSSSTSSGAYSIQNMKEEPNVGANTYSSAVNGNGPDDMAVSTRSLAHQNCTARYSFANFLNVFLFAELWHFHSPRPIRGARISFSLTRCTKSTTVFRK